MARLAATRPRSHRTRGHLRFGAAARQRLSERARGGGARRLDPARPLARQIAPILSRPVAPIWMDSSTSAECAEIDGGGRRRSARWRSAPDRARSSGSPAAQIRKFSQAGSRGLRGDRSDPSRQLVSRVAAVGRARAARSGRRIRHEPDGSRGRANGGRRRSTPPPPGSRAEAAVDRAGVRCRRHALAGTGRSGTASRAANVIAWSGDNPCSLVGVGLVREGRLAVSLGTSDTVFGLMREPRVDRDGHRATCSARRPATTWA